MPMGESNEVTGLTQVQSNVYPYDDNVITLLAVFLYDYLYRSGLA